MSQKLRKFFNWAAKKTVRTCRLIPFLGRVIHNSIIDIGILIWWYAYGWYKYRKMRMAALSDDTVSGSPKPEK